MSVLYAVTGLHTNFGTYFYIFLGPFSFRGWGKSKAHSLFLLPHKLKVGKECDIVETLWHCLSHTLYSQLFLYIEWVLVQYKVYSTSCIQGVQALDVSFGFI